jgi:hypothetical protein
MYTAPIPLLQAMLLQSLSGVGAIKVDFFM